MTGRLPTAAGIARFLNTLLRVRSFRDASVNGLQVRPRAGQQVRTVGFAVDACLTTIDQARKRRVDLLVVHHGIRWRPRRDRELEERRAGRSACSGIALYAVHLPLDLHREYGNNMQLCRLLGVEKPRRFGRYHGVKIGYAGSFKAPVTMEWIARILDRGLMTSCRTLSFGSKEIRSVGVISGGGGGALAEACADGLDCFITGEIDLAVFNAARDRGMNVIVAGHYATETMGVRALMTPVRERFGVRTVFLDDPKDL